MKSIDFIANLGQSGDDLALVDLCHSKDRKKIRGTTAEGVTHAFWRKNFVKALDQGIAAVDEKAGTVTIPEGRWSLMSNNITGITYGDNVVDTAKEDWEE